MSKNDSHTPTRIELEGEYDLTRKDEIKRLFRALDGDGPLVIDFSRVTFLDSTILAELAKLRVNREDRRIALAGASKAIRHIFEIVAFDQIFTLEE